MKLPWSLLVVIAVSVGCGADKTSAPSSEDIPSEKDAGSEHSSFKCEITEKDAPDFVQTLGCVDDFTALSSEPVDANLPGSTSVKVVLDQSDNGALYFQNSQKYQIHYQFASTHLSGGTHPIVPPLSSFNETEYYSPERRFLLGAVTYYAGPKVWALEIAPYDTASAEMITTLYESVKKHVFFGDELKFHPTSQSVEVEGKKLTKDVRQISTDEIYQGTDYQPLTLGTAMGRLHFALADNLDTEYLSYRDIVVLDEAPNDISVVSGLITQEFQTPLSHVNVLSENRGTPNMGLRDATTNETLRALEGKWVELSVGPSTWTIREVSVAEADAYWEAHKPEPLSLPALDLSVSGLHDIEELVPETKGVPLRDELKKAVLAYGGKAAHYSLLAKTNGVPVPKAFAIPVFYYDQFMRENGFYERIDALLVDGNFTSDFAVRDRELQSFREAMMSAQVNENFQALLKAKLAKDYPNTTMRFRTSTNSEDLDGFPCAGCYESHTGDPANWEDVLDAIRETYASIWLFRTFEERAFYGIDHKSVGMALLVHHNFPDEEANGVALTANPFDASGLEPGFYVNVQKGGDAEVVHPPAGITSDEFLYFFSAPNQPITFISHSNLVEDGETVLTARQTYELGKALAAIHERFSPAYGPKAGNDGWYAMDVEFKFDGAVGQEPSLYVKQARPHPGRGDQ